MYKYFNPNPLGKSVDDGIIRALCKATEKRWDDVLLDLFVSAYNLADVPTSSAVWGDYLKKNNFKQFLISEEKTVKEFCELNNNGEYIAVTPSHAVYILDGNYYDEWNSGEEEVSYYFRRDYV